MQPCVTPFRRYHPKALLVKRCTRDELEAVAAFLDTLSNLYSTQKMRNISYSKHQDFRRIVFKREGRPITPAERERIEQFLASHDIKENLITTNGAVEAKCMRLKADSLLAHFSSFTSLTDSGIRCTIENAEQKKAQLPPDCAAAVEKLVKPFIFRICRNDSTTVVADLTRFSDTLQNSTLTDSSHKVIPTFDRFELVNCLCDIFRKYEVNVLDLSYNNIDEQRLKNLFCGTGLKSVSTLTTLILSNNNICFDFDWDDLLQRIRGARSLTRIIIINNPICKGRDVLVFPDMSRQNIEIYPTDAVLCTVYKLFNGFVDLLDMQMKNGNSVEFNKYNVTVTKKLYPTTLLQAGQQTASTGSGDAMPYLFSGPNGGPGQEGVCPGALPPGAGDALISYTQFECITPAYIFYEINKMKYFKDGNLVTSETPFIICGIYGDDSLTNLQATLQGNIIRFRTRYVAGYNVKMVPTQMCTDPQSTMYEHLIQYNCNGEASIGPRQARDSSSSTHRYIRNLTLCIPVTLNPLTKEQLVERARVLSDVATFLPL